MAHTPPCIVVARARTYGVWRLKAAAALIRLAAWFVAGCRTEMRFAGQPWQEVARARLTATIEVISA